MSKRFQTNQHILLSGLAFRFALAFLLCSTATALTPNPNPSGNTITVDIPPGHIDPFDNYGTINNYSTLYITLPFYNWSGEINNYGEINNDADIYNSADIYNYNYIYNSSNSSFIENYGTIYNTGIIDNYYYIDNWGDFNLYDSGTINNYGWIYNFGTLTLSPSGYVNNYGTIYNMGYIDNSIGGFNNSGTLKGEGSFGGDLITQDSGTVAPGHSIYSSGTMTVYGDFTLDGSGILDIEIGGFTQGSFDLLDITGTAFLSGGNINFSFLSGYDIIADVIPGQSRKLIFLNAGYIDNFNSVINYNFMSLPNFQFNVFQQGNELVFQATNTIPTPTESFFDDFDDKGLDNWDDVGDGWGCPAEFGCEEIYDIDQQVFINRHVLLLKAGQGAIKTTSQITTYEQWGPKGTFAAYVQFNDPDQNETFGDVSDQDFFAINRVEIGDPCYCEVDFEYLTCLRWDGKTAGDILQLNSWDRKMGTSDDDYQCPTWSEEGKDLDGQWVLLLFRVRDDYNVEFFLNNTPLTYPDNQQYPAPHPLPDRFRPKNAMQIEFSNWFFNESTDPTERTYTMKVDWVFYSSEILNPDEVREEINKRRAPPCKPAMVITAMCPVDLIVTDPDGLQTSKRVNNISGAIYLDGDGDPDDVVTISETLPGCYLIKVIPEAGASPTDTFTLVVNRDGITRVLAQDVQVQDIPEFPFVVTTLDSLSADMEIDPETLNLDSQGNWITCYIQFPEAYYVANIDSSTILLNGEIPPARFFAGNEEDIEQILMIKFDRSDLQQIIQPGNIELIVTGELFDGTPFECRDTIKVIE